MHERGVLHRDIKGGNILITDKGHVKLGIREREEKKTRRYYERERESRAKKAEALTRRARTRKEGKRLMRMSRKEKRREDINPHSGV